MSLSPPPPKCDFPMELFEVLLLFVFAIGIHWYKNTDSVYYIYKLIFSIIFFHNLFNLALNDIYLTELSNVCFHCQPIFYRLVKFNLADS